MKKKNYIKPEMEVSDLQMQTVCVTFSAPHQPFDPNVPTDVIPGAKARFSSSSYYGNDYNEERWTERQFTQHWE